jgi:hypothetical protein
MSAKIYHLPSSQKLDLIEDHEEFLAQLRQLEGAGPVEKTPMPDDFFWIDLVVLGVIWALLIAVTVFNIVGG